MDFVNYLPPELTEVIFSYLPVKDLCFAGECNTLWREQTNQNNLWINQCSSRGWIKFGKESAHILLGDPLTAGSISLKFRCSPIFNFVSPPNSSISPVCRWKEIFMKANHLNGNWNNGRYVVQTLSSCCRGRVFAFDCNGRVLVEGSNDGSVVLWNLSSRTILHRLDIGREIRVVKLHENNAVIGCSDGSIQTFDIKAGQLVETFCFHDNNSIEHLVIQGALIVSASDEGELTVWSLSRQERLYALVGHTDEVECMCMSTSGDLLVTGSYDRSLVVWNVAIGQLLHQLLGHSECINCCEVYDQKVLIIRLI